MPYNVAENVEDWFIRRLDSVLHPINITMSIISSPPTKQLPDQNLAGIDFLTFNLFLQFADASAIIR